MYSQENAIKTTADLLNDGKSAVACIHFLLINASRHAVSEAVFSEEIQQLGLPKEHAASMCRVLAANVTQICQRLQDKAFRSEYFTFIKNMSIYFFHFVNFYSSRLTTDVHS